MCRTQGQPRALPPGLVFPRNICQGQGRSSQSCPKGGTGCAGPAVGTVITSLSDNRSVASCSPSPFAPAVWLWSLPRRPGLPSLEIGFGCLDPAHGSALLSGLALESPHLPKGELHLPPHQTTTTHTQSFGQCCSKPPHAHGECSTTGHFSKPRRALASSKEPAAKPPAKHLSPDQEWDHLVLRAPRGSQPIRQLLCAPLSPQSHQELDPWNLADLPGNGARAGDSHQPCPIQQGELQK